MKIRKVFTAFLCVFMSVAMLSINVLALNAKETQEKSIELQKNILSVTENKISAVVSDDIVYLGNVNWSDSKTVKWKEGNTTAYHTITSRLSDLYVYDTYVIASSYTNYKGTYSNVWLLEVAPNTLFMSADVYNSPSTGYNRDYTDPYFGLDTPRRLTSSELDSEGVVAYVVFDPNSETVIDFYSVFNPLIMSGWSDPKINF